MAGRQTVAAFLLAHFLAIVLLAVCPELHHSMHQDSDSREHECAVTLFVHGACEGASLLLAIVIVQSITRFSLPRQSLLCLGSLFLSRRQLDHAPPGGVLITRNTPCWGCFQ